MGGRLILLFFILMPSLALGQGLPDNLPDSVRSMIEQDETFTIVEVPAQPKDGMAKFYKFIADNIKVPKSARKARVSGRVYVQFVVDKDGTIMPDSVRVLRLEELKEMPYGANNRALNFLQNEDCENEAVRVIRMSPPWLPGTQRGKPVRQRMIVPIIFNAQ